MSKQAAPTLSSYQLQLQGFEGPLDVLLQLIERQRLDISDLSLVAVTDGFLEHIAGLENPPPRLLGEFVGIAARLLVLKSRSLLPRLASGERDEEVDDLAAQLREYQRVKRLAALMRESEESGWRSFPQQGGPPKRNVNVTLIVPGLRQFHETFLRAVARQPEAPALAPIRQIVSIADMARRIMSVALRPGHRFRFAEIVTGSNRHETVAAFVALLTLWSRREVQVDQKGMFGDIEIRNAHSGEGD